MPHGSSDGPSLGLLHVLLQAVDLTSFLMKLPSAAGSGWTHKKHFYYKLIVACPQFRMSLASQ